MPFLGSILGDLSQYKKIIQVSQYANLPGDGSSNTLTNYLNISGSGYLSVATLVSNNTGYLGHIQIVIDGVVTFWSQCTISGGYTGIIQETNFKGGGSIITHVPQATSNAMESWIGASNFGSFAYGTGSLPTNPANSGIVILLPQPLFFQNSLQINMAGAGYATNSYAGTFGWYFSGMYK